MRFVKIKEKDSFLFSLENTVLLTRLNGSPFISVENLNRVPVAVFLSPVLSSPVRTLSFHVSNVLASKEDIRVQPEACQLTRKQRRDADCRFLLWTMKTCNQANTEHTF